jgi:hypothetical protein
MFFSVRCSCDCWITYENYSIILHHRYDYAAPSRNLFGVRKEPKTDPGKMSKKGRHSLVLIEDDAETPGLRAYRTVPYQGHEDLNQLRVVYEDGVHFNDQKWADIVEQGHHSVLAIVGLL